MNFIPRKNLNKKIISHSYEVFSTRPLNFFYLTALFLTFNGCAPLDQRYFDPQAGISPMAHLKHSDEKKPLPKKSFIEVIEGTSEQTYGASVETAAKIALQRKSNILFIVESIIPQEATPEKQIAHFEKMNKDLLLPISQHLITAGVQPIQIDMRTLTDPALTQGIVRIYVK